MCVHQHKARDAADTAAIENKRSAQASIAKNHTSKCTAASARQRPVVSKQMNVIQLICCYVYQFAVRKSFAAC